MDMALPHLREDRGFVLSAMMSGAGIAKLPECFQHDTELGEMMYGDGVGWGVTLCWNGVCVHVLEPVSFLTISVSLSISPLPQQASQGCRTPAAI